MLPSQGAGGAVQGKWSARFPVYHIDFSNVAAGKKIAASKRRIRFRFGFSNAEAIDSGKTGTACRGSEHDVTLVWSISSGKRLILADGHEVHYSTVRSNIFEHSWTMRGNRVLKILAYAVPPNASSGQRQFDLYIDGQSFWHMPKVYELGIRGPSAAIARKPGVISDAERREVSPPTSPQEEKDDLRKAIQASLEESREHLGRTSINDHKKPAAPSSPNAVAPTPAPATQVSSGPPSGDLLDFGFEDTAPAPAPTAAVVPSSAPAPYASPDDLFGVPPPAPSQVAAVPDPFLGSPAPSPSQVAAFSDSLIGGPAPTEAAAAPNPFLDGPAPTPAPAKVVAEPSPAPSASAATNPFDSAPPATSAPAAQTINDPFASQTVPAVPVVQQPAAPQPAADPFAPQPAAADPVSSILSAYGTDEPKATPPQAPEQSVSAVENGGDANNISQIPPSDQVVVDSTTAPPEQKSVEQVTGVDSAMNKLVDFDDIFGQKEEPPTLSMNPFGETEKEKKQTGDTSEHALSIQAGPQPTLGEMKTVKAPTTGSSSIMEPAATGIGTVEGQVQSAAPVDPFGSAPIQPYQSQMPVQQQPQPQQPQPTSLDPFAGL